MSRRLPEQVRGYGGERRDGARDRVSAVFDARGSLRTRAPGAEALGCGARRRSPARGLAAAVSVGAADRERGAAVDRSIDRSTLPTYECAVLRRGRDATTLPCAYRRCRGASQVRL